MIKTRRLIAIVDDEESVRRALTRLMVSAGFEVASYSNGAELLASVKTRRPDCVVLDLHMPGMSGFDVQSALAKAKDPMPVIAITGHDTPEIHKRVMDAGAEAYLRKPIDAMILLDAIAAAIGPAKP